MHSSKKGLHLTLYMYFRPLKFRPEYPFVQHFASNWAAYCRDNKINQSRTLKTIGKRRDYVSHLKQGHYGYDVSLYTLQVLADLIGISIMDLINYKPREEQTTSNNIAVNVPAQSHK